MRWLLLLLLALAPLVLGAGPHTPRWMRVRVTAYCPCSVCTDGDGITAYGRSAYRDGVAVDPLVIRRFSHIDVPGYGPWKLADDTGSGVRGAHIDIRFQDHETALQYGTRYLRVRIWE